MIDVVSIKKDFPIFQKQPDLVYLDSGATSLKPNVVIEKLKEYYTDYTANVFRGVYKNSERATEEYEETRTVVANFIHAYKPEEIIFTRNTTESLNLIAYSLGKKVLDERGEVAVTLMEHHSNFVPWQQLAFENGAAFKVIEIDNQGYLRGFNAIDEIISRETKIVALTYVSNVLGTINPIKDIIAKIKRVNPSIITVVDGAQAVSHMPVDVQDLGCDFFVFSSHKMLGPSGVGIVWGKYELLDTMYPFLYGGEMVETVRINETTFKKPPHKYEAGTPDIGGVIALKEAVRYLQGIGWDAIRSHEKELTRYTFDALYRAFGEKIHIYGPPATGERAGILSFMLGKVHAHDVAQVLDEGNIAVRAGHHCAMPLHDFLGVPATTRITLQIYNNEVDIDACVVGLQKALTVFL